MRDSWLMPIVPICGSVVENEHHENCLSTMLPSFTGDIFNVMDADIAQQNSEHTQNKEHYYSSF